MDTPESAAQVIVVANHDPESTRLRREFEAVANAQPKLVEVRVGHASAFGYGLYDDFVMDIATSRDSRRSRKHAEEIEDDKSSTISDGAEVAAK